MRLLGAFLRLLLAGALGAPVRSGRRGGERQRGWGRRRGSWRSGAPRAAPASPRLSPLQAPEARGTASEEAPGELEEGGSQCLGWERVTGGGSGVPGLLSARPEPPGGSRGDPGGSRDLCAPGLLSRAQRVPILKSGQRSLAAEGMEGTELAEPLGGSWWLWEPPQQRGDGHKGSSASLCPTVGHDPVTAAPVPPHPLQRVHLTGGLGRGPPSPGHLLRAPLGPSQS